MVTLQRCDGELIAGECKPRPAMNGLPEVLAISCLRQAAIGAVSTIEKPIPSRCDTFYSTAF